MKGPWKDGDIVYTVVCVVVGCGVGYDIIVCWLRLHLFRYGGKVQMTTVSCNDV